MIVGIPGTGIGGLYYLFIALWMPIRELYCRLKRGGCLMRKHLVKRQLLITACIIMGMWATGKSIALLITLIFLHHNGVHVKGVNNVAVNNIFHITPFLLAMVVLMFVYMSIHALRFYIFYYEMKK